MRTSNPALSDKRFQNQPLGATGEVMTLSGTVNKSLILVTLVLLSALWSWNNVYPDGWSAEAVPVMPFWYIGVIIFTIILSLIIIFKPTTAPYLAPGYALGEGLLLGSISALFEYRYPGIAMQAMLGTLGTFVALLAVYRTGIIKVTNNFRMGVFAATGGIALVYLIDMILRFFGMNVPFIHEGGTTGIIVSLIIVGIAALNLVLDFDFIEQGAQARAPKYMEWYSAFGLLVTLVWMYLEILKLLAKSRDR